MDRSGGDVDNGGGGACVGAEDMWESSMTPPQFCCEPRSALKYKVLIKNFKI